MNKFTSIRNKAFINELQKIAVNTNHIKDLYNFIKKASFFDEKHILNSCGSGSTCKFIKTAKNEYSITPGYWEGKKGLHRAIAEDPKKHSMIMPEYLGASLGSSILAGQVSNKITGNKHSNKIFAENPDISQVEFKKLFRKASSKSALIPSLVAGLFAGELAKHKLENNFLNQYGIKKNLLDPRYHYTHEAYQKYYQ
jgi:hypothetical protein